MNTQDLHDEIADQHYYIKLLEEGIRPLMEWVSTLLVSEDLSDYGYKKDFQEKGNQLLKNMYKLLKESK